MAAPTPSCVGQRVERSVAGIQRLRVQRPWCQLLVRRVLVPPAHRTPHPAVRVGVYEKLLRPTQHSKD